MPTDIQQWFENVINGFSFNAAAKQSGLTMSTVRRHLVEESKTGSAPETIVRICRAYHLNPVHALIEAGLIQADEVKGFAKDADFAAGLADASARDIMDRMHEQLRELEGRLLPHQEIAEQVTPALGGMLPDPDYSNMSAEDAKDYGLAAKPEDEHIAHDELPNHP